MTRLAGLATPEQQKHFLDKYWQQQPLYLPQALPNFVDPIDADDLAGLATLDSVASRLISGIDTEVQHGPFSDAQLASMPTHSSTLLVQSVDQYDSDVATLKQAFDFIPAWRLDDVMVSFATPLGGVGPHFDYYDVFLIQGKGQRHWRLGQWCDSTTPVDGESGQRVLKEFVQSAEFHLNSGDVLYVPPGLAHWGVATENCLTYSIGFRAPSLAEIAAEWAGESASQITDDRRFVDHGGFHFQKPDTQSGQRPASAELPKSAVQHTQQQLLAMLQDTHAVAAAVGRLQTFVDQQDFDESSIKPAEPDIQHWSLLKIELDKGAKLHRQESARACYFCDNGTISVFFNGEQHTLPATQRPWIELLCEQTQLSKHEIFSHCASEDDASCELNIELLSAMISADAWQLAKDAKNQQQANDDEHE